jgi:hypothetical protein
MAKALTIPFDGSKPLKNNMHERYARLRAQALPRIVAYRKAGNTIKSDNGAGVNSHRLDGKPSVRARIEFLVREAQERLIEKRVALEEHLWAVHEADIGAFWETYEAAKTGKGGELETDQEGKMLTVRKQRAKLINDLPPEFRKLIEDVTVDRHGNVVPKLYSKTAANKGLRELLNIGSQREPEQTDGSRLSDAELIAQLAEQANQLGVKIDLSYDFGQQPTDDAETNGSDGQVIDTVAQPAAADCSGVDAQHAEEERRAAEAARELKLRSPVPAGARKKR